MKISERAKNVTQHDWPTDLLYNFFIENSESNFYLKENELHVLLKYLS